MTGQLGADAGDVGGDQILVSRAGKPNLGPDGISREEVGVAGPPPVCTVLRIERAASTRATGAASARCVFRARAMGRS